MNKIMQYIPGFRSGVRWKKIIATLYYLLALLSFSGGWGGGLFLLSMPFVVFSLIDLFSYKKKGNTLSKALVPFVLFFVIAIIGISNMPASTSTPDNDYAQTMETTSQSETANQLSDADQPISATSQQVEQEEPSSNPNAAINETTSTNPLKVHFIDVGQADSILVQTPGGKTMLIDAGNNADGDAVVSYIKSQGINKIDVLVGTHPHEDHIGGMDAVINSFDIGKIYMPKATANTKTYEDVLNAVAQKGLKIATAKGSMAIDIDPTINVDIFAPNSSAYDDLNNYSAVIKLTYKNTSFLLDGDAEDISEQEMLSKGYDLKADVLKIGHHGSSSSTTSSFLNAVSPEYAVISVGKGNDYGHPAQETMDKLKAANIAVYRTDESGTIIATSDGENITFNCNPGSYNGFASNSNASNSAISSAPKTETAPPPVVATSKDRIVYWTPKGKSYHYSKGCRTLSRSKTILSGPLSECPKSDPCDICTQ